MPVTKSALKALRQDRRRTRFNLLIGKRIKQVLKETRLKPSLSNLKKASSVLDRAAKNKVIHRNKAARLKSRLAQANRQRPSQPKRKSSPQKA